MAKFIVFSFKFSIIFNHIICMFCFFRGNNAEMQTDYIDDNVEARNLFATEGHSVHLGVYVLVLLC